MDALDKEARRMLFSMASAALACLLLAAVHPARAATVLMISVDGMKPEYVTQADAHGLKIPFLRSMLAHGAYADGVTGVWPTITYPSHTTLITGVAPAEHGIYSNLEFDPKHTFADSCSGMPRKFAPQRCGGPRTTPACPPRASAGRSASVRQRSIS